MSKIYLQEPQRNRNAIANFVNLIRTSTVRVCVAAVTSRLYSSLVQLSILSCLAGSSYVVLCLRKLNIASAGARGVDSVTAFITVNKRSQSNRDCGFHSTIEFWLPGDHITSIYLQAVM